MSKTPGDGRSIVSARLQESFVDRLLVDCPTCGGKAVITPTAPVAVGRNPAAAARRMLCHACGAVREQAETPSGHLVDPFMSLTPRLRAETRHGVLQAWNEDHLDHIEQYLAGHMRLEQRREPGAAGNQSVISRLPVWAKAAKNRDEMLKAIAKLKRERL